MEEPDLTGVDVEEVLKRLTLHAIAECVALAGVSKGGVLTGLGVGPDDLAMQTIMKFLDPQDGTVAWKRKHGEATTDSVLRFLKTVLRNDLIDLLRSKAHETTVIVETQPNCAEQDDRPIRQLSLQEFADSSEGQDLRAIRANQHAWLLQHFEDEPDLRDVLSTQLDPDGYQAYTNQQLAELLETSVVDIQNRKKRIRTRLSHIDTGLQNYAGKEADHV